jgi:hypothetical protein
MAFFGHCRRLLADSLYFRGTQSKEGSYRSTMHFRLSAALAVVAAVILSPLAAYAQVPNVGNTRCVSNCSSTSADCSPATIAAAQDAVAKMPGIIAKESAQLAAGVSNPQQVTDDIALARRLLAAGQSILASCQGAGAAPAAPAAPPAPAPKAAPPGPSG